MKPDNGAELSQITVIALAAGGSTGVLFSQIPHTFWPRDLIVYDEG